MLARLGVARVRLGDWAGARAPLEVVEVRGRSDPRALDALDAALERELAQHRARYAAGSAWVEGDAPPSR